nr:hypothetical protein [Tanacetum cinerariifolium]
MPSHIKPYDGSEDPGVHLKIFQAAAKTEWWAMPTWCHMFNSTLTRNARVWFDDLLSESVDIYDDLKKHSWKTIFSRKGGARVHEDLWIVHEIKIPELINRLHDKIPKTMDEMMRVTTSFLRGKWQLKNHKRKKSFLPWRQQEGNQKHGFRKENFRNQQRPERKQDRFTLLTKTPKEIFALEKGKFKAPSLMTTPVEKQNHTKFCEFHGEVRHNTDECMHLKKQIEEMLKAGKLSYLIKELKQNNGKEQPKTAKKEETPGKEKPKLQAVSSAAHGMLKISVEGGIIILKSSMLVPLECVMVSEPEGSLLVTKPMVEERIKLADMTGVPRHIVEHRLNVREGCSPVRKKKKRQAADINQAIQEEVGKLVEAGIMKEVHYNDWLSNLVMVKKHDGSWRMCVDFKDLNKACPKDGYPLPEIDWKISRNLKVYVDDLVIKSRMEDEIVRDIDETFKTLREISMKLNPKKCTFEVEEGMFLGYKINTKGLKVCPDKSDFHWITEDEDAFKKMKQLIAELPMLTAPMEKEELIVYLAALKETVSAVLMIEKETKQMLIYFVSRALMGPKINYISMVKLVLALVHAIKGQILVDFIVERPEEDSLDTLMTEEEKLPEPWILFTDGSSCTDGSGTGLILINLEEMEFIYALRFRFDATNNEAKYEALISELKIAEQIGEKSISTIEVLAVVEEEGDTWMTPIFKYLTDGILPADSKKARAAKRKSWRFAVVNRTLYKKYFLGPWLRCVGPLQANYVLREIHEGSCSMHTGPGKVKFLIVAIDYFTKWIEAKPIATITAIRSKNLCGTTLSADSDSPERLSRTMENGFRTIHSRTGAKNYLKRRNKSKVGCKKQELDGRAPSCSMGTPTMIKSSNGDTPFLLTYRTEAVIPTEIGMPTLRTSE